MRIRHIFMLAVTIVLVAAVTIGLLLTPSSEAADAQAITQLENVRDLELAVDPTTQDASGTGYAVDGGRLYAGRHGRWSLIETPSEVIVSTVAVEPDQNGSSETRALYIGAANLMAIYRSIDGGLHWQQIPLSKSAIGGVTTIALDTNQRLVYAGTDTAGIFRLRDVGSSMILNGQIVVDEPVRQIVVDSHGSGLVLARTDGELLRAENFGLTWITVDNLHSSPTALALAPASAPDMQPLILVGTLDRGLLTSQDGGHSWRMANEGLGFVPGSRLSIDALTIDPVNPDVLYLSTSYIFGSTTLHSTPNVIAMSTDRTRTWTTLVHELDASVVELIPVPGQTGDLYALTSRSRTPFEIGNAPALVATNTNVNGSLEAEAQIARRGPAGVTALLAWIIAGLAALALAYAVFLDLRVRRSQSAGVEPKGQTQPVQNRSQ